MSRDEAVTVAPGSFREGEDRAPLTLLGGFVLASRLPFLFGELIGKDGHLYLEALQLDGATFAVPPPGNLGFVLLAKALTLVGFDGAQAYAVVNLLLTLLGVASCYGLAKLLLRERWAAFWLALAVAASPLVWASGASISSYLVWLAALPSIAYFGVRFYREGRARDLMALSVAYGLGMFLRPDVLAFGGPLWLFFWLSRRLPLGQRLASLGPVACGFLAWFLGTSLLLGSVGELVAKVAAQSSFHGSFGIAGAGLFEGLARNGVKYGLFLAWSAPLALAFSVVGAVRLGRGRGEAWQYLGGAVAWWLPSLLFSTLVFAGTPGLVFPAIPVVYLLAAAAWYRKDLTAGAVPARRARGFLAGAALASLLQFVAVPMLPVTDQRNVILNVMFCQHSAAGLRAGLPPNLTDYGMDPSLANVVRQLRDPEPVPRLP